MRRHAQKEEQTEINITPMLDVVFIMLIFFIVTASFIKEAGIEIFRPAAETAEKQDKASILIAINENGQVWMEKQVVDPSAVRANVERLRAENPEGSVVVQADKDAQVGITTEVIDAVRDAGVSNYVLSTEEAQ